MPKEQWLLVLAPNNVNHFCWENTWKAWNIMIPTFIPVWFPSRSIPLLFEGCIHKGKKIMKKKWRKSIDNGCNNTKLEGQGGACVVLFWWWWWEGRRDGEGKGGAEKWRDPKRTPKRAVFFLWKIQPFSTQTPFERRKECCLCEWGFFCFGQRLMML